MWGQTGRTPFLYATEPNEKLVNVPSVPALSTLRKPVQSHDILYTMFLDILYKTTKGEAAEFCGSAPKNQRRASPPRKADVEIRKAV
jgi:hypothetical protein